MLLAVLLLFQHDRSSRRLSLWLVYGWGVRGSGLKHKQIWFMIDSWVCRLLSLCQSIGQSFDLSIDRSLDPRSIHLYIHLSI